MNLDNLLLSLKDVFRAIVQIYFQSSSEWFVCLRIMIHDTWIFIKYQTGAIRDHVRLVKLLIFSKAFSRLLSNYIFKVPMNGS